MPAPLVLTYDTNAAASATNFADRGALASYLGSLNLVDTDQEATLICYSDLIMDRNYYIAKGDDDHRLKIVPAAGLGVNDLWRTTFNYGSSGVAIIVHRAQYGRSLGSCIDLENMRIHVIGTALGLLTDQRFFSNVTVDNYFRYCRIYDDSGTNQTSITAGSNYNVTKIEDCLFVNDGTLRVQLFANGSVTVSRCTLAAIGPNKLQGTFCHAPYGGMMTLDNCIAVDYPTIGTSNVSHTNCYSNTPIAAGGATSGITIVGAGNLCVNEANDYRLKPGVAAIDTATASANSTKDILGNNRGPTPDVGAWEVSPYAPSPTGNVTSVVVNDQTITVTGTTANTPTNGTIKLIPVSVVPFNSAVGQGPVDVNLTVNGFNKQFTNAKVGLYDLQIILGNAGGSNEAVYNLGNIEVTGAYGVATSYVLNGDKLTVSGTTTGNPTSLSVLVPAAATDPQDAVSVSQEAVLGAGTFSAEIILGPGRFGLSVIRATNAKGTSLPFPTTNMFPILIEDIAGDPAAPDIPEPVTPPVVNVPDAPTSIVATAGIESASIAFVAPANNGGAGILDYTATLSTGETKTGTQSPLVFINLSANVARTATVKARNMQGPSVASAASNSFTPTAAVVVPVLTAPGAPIIGTPVAGNGFIDVFFSPPLSNGGSPITSYTAILSTGESISGNTIPLRVIASNGVARTASVAATNAIDTGPMSAASVSITPVAPQTGGGGNQTPSRTVVLEIVTGRDTNGVLIPAANLAGLSVAIYNETEPHLYGVARYQSNTVTLDAQGMKSITFPTTLDAGDECGVVVRTVDGRNFCMKLEVA